MHEKPPSVLQQLGFTRSATPPTSPADGSPVGPTTAGGGRASPELDSSRTPLEEIEKKVRAATRDCPPTLALTRSSLQLRTPANFRRVVGLHEKGVDVRETAAFKDLVRPMLAQGGAGAVDVDKLKVRPGRASARAK